MSQKPTIYYALFSPPSRACLITAKLIGLDVDLKVIDFKKREHMSEEFIKLNPQHQVPVFVDTDGEVFTDSHAIICFMVAKYAKNDQLYTTDLKRRAHIDHRLHFENGELFQVLKDFVGRNIYGGESEYNKRSVELCESAYDVMEQFLTQSTFMAGNELSVADISINTTLITLDLIYPVDQQRYPQICGWLQRMQKLLPDYEEVNLKGAQTLEQVLKRCMAEHKAKS